MSTYKPIAVFFSSFLKLKIKGKLSIAFIGFSILPILVLGVSAWHLNSRSIRESTIKELAHLSEVINLRLRDFTEGIRKDQLFILRGFQGETETQLFHALEMNGLKRRAYDLMQTRKPYAGITILADSLKGPVFSIRRKFSEPDLVQFRNSIHSWYYYNVLMDGLLAGQMRITPVQQIDPYTGGTLPAFSFAMPIILNSEKVEGILVLDVFAKGIFAIIESSLDKTQQLIAGIVDKSGRFLYHSEKKQDWNRLIAEASIKNLYSEFSQSIADEILSVSPGESISENGDVIYHLPMTLGTFGFQQNYYLYILQPGKVVFAPVRSFGLISIGLALVFIILAYVLSQEATRRFVTPIQRLQEGSDILAKGDFSHRIHLNTGDEMEHLANKFNYMARSINERDQKLKDYSAQLEVIVKSRTTELQDEKDKLRIILDNVPSAFLLVDQQQKVLMASSALKELTGFTPQEAIGKQCSEVLNNPEACENCQLKSTGKSKVISRKEYQVKSKKITKTFELVNIPVSLKSGEPACLEILSDISTRIQLQDQLLQSEKLASIGEMAAVIAHEIRNSLTSANMLLQLVNESETVSVSDKKSLDVVLSSIDRINQITNDLLTFARPSPLHMEFVDINKILDESISLYQPHLDKKNILIKRLQKKGLPLLNVDRNLIHEVFSNILLNSCQAINDHGIIEIYTDIIPVEEDIQLRLQHTSTGKHIISKSDSGRIEGARMIKIVFKDNGPGIPFKSIKKVFDPFYTTKINGTGLGLSMAKRVVESHRGLIMAESLSQKGVEISIYLPLEVSA